MTKLKTLKDFSKNYMLLPDVEEDLRQEAIKWIKELREIVGKDISLVHDWCSKNFSDSFHKYIPDKSLRLQLLAIIYGYQHFFNITEKELK